MSLQFLADENVPGLLVRELRNHGVDVAWIGEDAMGDADTDVLKRAASERRVLLTFDKDFGALAFHHKLPAECGVVLFRLPGLSVSALTSHATAVVLERHDLNGHFTVVTESRIRMRRLPQ